MKAKVTEECIVCGLCVDICPDVFEMGDQYAQVKTDIVPSDSEKPAQQAADECPVSAIVIEPLKKFKENKMKNRKTQLTTIISLICLLLAVLVVAGGCKKSEKRTSTQASIQTEQTVCPITGKPINKDVYTEYEGKKVYFCCPACKSKFEKNPEKYVSKLPQFEQTSPDTAY